MSVHDEGVSFSLEVNVEPAYTKMRKVHTIIYRALGLMRRTGLLPDVIDQTIAKIQRVIALANQARLTFIALHAASGPYGWLLAGVGLGATILTAADVMMELDAY